MNRYNTEARVAKVKTASLARLGTVVDILGTDKLFEVTANGIGSVAGRLFTAWKARKAGEARVIAAQADARVLQIRAQAHKEARELLLADQNHGEPTEIEIGETITERVRYREQTRLSNIGAVVSHAAVELEGKHVGDNNVEDDWIARFFNDIQDVSSDEMHVLWGKVLAGEIERPGGTSLRTLGILRDLDQLTASLFARFCSVCVFAFLENDPLIDARVPSLDGHAGTNSLADFDLGFGNLNRLQEHGLLISDFHSWFDYGPCIVSDLGSKPLPSFQHQGREWALVAPTEQRPPRRLALHGVALTVSGRELSLVVDTVPVPRYLERLCQFFASKKLEMRDVTALVS